MLSLSSTHPFYLYDAPCDMRKSFDGLCGLIHHQMNKVPTSGEVFIFLNKSRTHIKLLHWEYGGYVLYYKRLEQGTFSRPKQRHQPFSYSDLVLMIEGINVLKSTHKKRYSLA
ncbi:IS66 family insertion sequence element accessory protein TnpB [Rhizosphaericola mali]|uniref:IS66 family insertion sequence element accessory protein TnpB n=1 Tax=Rhizosphaericola mali TaxID=2545455 RepID=A0A5P2G8Z7_9BACT|nr:IS66 family insertion sequence element accessory protein TnpB [Rhizosphaericola mali]QES89693.1 IS66 family insertion sequence element accessory protein TnpB [Rhizosphaericola mali]